MGRARWGWLGISRRRAVVLSSPYPAGECFERMATVTTLRSAASWYIDRRTLGLPDPLFRGVAAPPAIQVGRWKKGGPNKSFAAHLDVRPGPEAPEAPEANDGATLTGWIGLNRGVQVLWPVLAGIAYLISLGILAAGVVQLASGRMSGLLPALLFWIPGTLFAGANVSSLRSLEQNITELLEDVNGVLDSTATFP